MKRTGLSSSRRRTSVMERAGSETGGSVLPYVTGNLRLRYLPYIKLSAPHMSPHMAAYNIMR